MENAYGDEILTHGSFFTEGFCSQIAVPLPGLEMGLAAQITHQEKPPEGNPPYGILRTALVEFSHQPVILPTVGMMEHCKNLSGGTKNCAEEKPRRFLVIAPCRLAIRDQT